MTTDHFPPPASYFVDLVSAGAIVGTLIGWLPYVAAVVGLVWYCIQIWESRTVQHWWNNRQMILKARKIARLRAREKVIVAKLEALETIRAAKHAAVEKVETAKVEAAKQVLHENVQIAEHTQDASPEAGTQ